MAPLNDENEKCNRCHKPTVPLFGNGRKRWCPDCEGDKKKDPRDDKERTVPDPYGFQMFDPKDWRKKTGGGSGI